MAVELTPEQRAQWEKLRTTKGTEAAAAYRTRMLAQNAATAAPAPAPAPAAATTTAPAETADISLTPEQRARWEELRNTKGTEAASEYRKKMLAQNAAAAPVAAPAAAATPDPTTVPLATENTNAIADIITETAPKKDPGSVYAADVAAELDESAKQVTTGNADYVGPTGSQTTTLDPTTGKATITNKLADDQQKILDQGETLTQTGQAKAQTILNTGGFDSAWNANLGQRTVEGGFTDDRKRIEDAVYGNLTRRFDRDQGRLVQDKERELYNKGIPFSDDPNSRWQREMGVINESFNDRRDNAALQATQYGGSELDREFGMQESIRGTDFGQSLTTRQQGVSDITSLSTVGTGLMGPTEKAYVAPNYDVQDASTYIYGAENLKDIDKDRKLEAERIANENAIANKTLAQNAQVIAASNRPSGGGTPEPPPFP